MSPWLEVNISMQRRVLEVEWFYCRTGFDSRQKPVDATGPKNRWLGFALSYRNRHPDATGGTSVNLQGIQFDTNQGGRLPIEKYLAATLSARTDLVKGV